MRVLITGANGLLGQKLVNLLSADTSVETHATGRGANRNISGNYEYHKVDLAEEGALHNLFQQERPDAVIHTAAMTNVDACETDKKEAWLQNVTNVEAIARACETFDVFLTHLSTDFIFDGVSGPYDEESLPEPLSEYGRTKLAAEESIKASSIKWSIARTVLVYGQVHDQSRSNIVLWVKNSLEAGKSINVITDQWRMPTLAEDLAMGCWLMTKQKAQGIFNISGADLLNPYEIAIQTAETFGLDSKLITAVDGSTFTQPAARPPRTELILDKAKTVIGYEPHSFSQGLEILKDQIT